MYFSREVKQIPALLSKTDLLYFMIDHILVSMRQIKTKPAGQS